MLKNTFIASEYLANWFTMNNMTSADFWQMVHLPPALTPVPESDEEETVVADTGARPSVVGSVATADMTEVRRRMTIGPLGEFGRSRRADWPGPRARRAMFPCRRDELRQAPQTNF